MRVFKSLRYEPDLEWEFIDGSIIKAHQHSAGARTEDNEGIGKSVAGNTTKIQAHLSLKQRHLIKLLGPFRSKCRFKAF